MNCLISIEGNIGVGKTTFLSLMKEALGVPFELVPEPVAEWQDFKETDPSNPNQLNILEMFYKDPKRYAYLFQTLCLGSRAKGMMNLKKKLKEDTNPRLYIFERSIECDKEVFARNFIITKTFTEPEWLLYNEYYEVVSKKFAMPMNGIIYLRADNRVCYERCKKRARNEEECIGVDYLEELDQRHEEWLRNKPNVLIIDAEEDYIGDIKVRGRVIKDIRDWLAKLA